MDVLLDEHGIDEECAKYMRNLIKEQFVTEMLKAVDELQAMFGHGGPGVFPVRAGEYFGVVCSADILFEVYGWSFCVNLYW